MSYWRRRDTAAFVVLVAALASGLCHALFWWQGSRANATLETLRAGHDVTTTHDDPVAVRAARGVYLAAHLHVEEAQAIAERLPSGDAIARATLLYDIANAHMRQAMMIFASAPMRQVAPMIQLAKSEYRAALRLDPGNWDARYNYDIAAAMVRDADPPPSSKGDEMAHERAYFPDIPGAPNGLP
jgi:mxaK protein